MVICFASLSSVGTLCIKSYVWCNIFVDFACHNYSQHKKTVVALLFGTCTLHFCYFPTISHRMHFQTLTINQNMFLLPPALNNLIL